MDEQRTIRVDQFLAHPPGRVWQALTDPVLLAKWLNAGPALLVLHEPTQAVDIGARTDILHALQRAADTGVTVLLVSSEPEDLVATCDRILVYGHRVGLRPARAPTPEQLANLLNAC